MPKVRKVVADAAAQATSLRSEGLLVTQWEDPPNASYPTHAHAQREVRVVLGGGMTFIAGGCTFELGPGDRIDFAPGEAHAARVGPGGVRYLAGTAR